MTEAERLASLLEIARANLREHLSSDLTGDRRYVAAMVANAMSIAARELRRSDAEKVPELQALRRLFPDMAQAELQPLRTRLVQEIRSGLLDDGLDHDVRAALHARVAARLAVSSPEYRV